MDEKPDKVWTYEDLVAIGETDDGKKYEIFDGELVVTAAPSMWHQEVLKRLFRMFDELERRGIAKVYFAPLDVVVSPTRVVQPDLLVILRSRKTIMHRTGPVTGGPDLAIEVLSPSHPAHDRVRKRRFYARIGIREYWIVDPEEKTIEVLELVEGGLSYRQHGWYASGDRVASAKFELALDLDPIFAPDDDDPPSLPP